MALIKSHDTGPEIYIRKLLFAKGYRFRVNYRPVSGIPDLYFTKKKVAIFIHGCFWHRHAGCQYAYMPKSNIQFWQNKFNSNLNRDQIVKLDLVVKRIRCLIIWECTIKKMQKNNEVEMAILSDMVRFIDCDQSVYLKI